MNEMWGMLLSPKIFVCGIIVTTLLLAPSCLVALNNSGGSGQALHNPANGLQEINLPFTSPPAYTFSYGIKFVGNFTVGKGPMGMAYDPLNNYIYVANYFGSNVTVMNGTKTVASVNVGTKPESISFDASNGYLYVANSASNNVSLINGTTVVHTIGKIPAPVFDTYDPANCYVYVDDSSDNNVTVINGTSIVTSIVSKGDPCSSGYDPSSNTIYVADFTSGNITLIRGINVIGNVTLGSTVSPYGVDYNPLNGYMYVSTGDTNLSVISGTRLLRNISIGSSFAFTAFDQADGLIWTDNYYSNSVSIIDNSSLVGSFAIKSSSPDGAVFSPYSGYMYIADRSSGNVTIFSTPTLVSFQETGLPAGTPWTVVFNGSSQSTGNASMRFGENYGSFTYNVTTPIYGAAGVRYTTSSPGSVTVGKTMITLPVPYTTQYLLAINSTPSGSGKFTPSSASWVNSTTVVAIRAISNPGYRFSYWFGTGKGSYTGNNATANVTMSSPLNEIAYFSGFTYTVTFEEVGLPSGTVWSVTFGGMHVKTTGTFIYFEKVNGTDSFVVPSVSGYAMSPSSGNITVSGGNVTEPIIFSSTNPLVGLEGFVTSQIFLEALVVILLIALIYSTVRRKRKKVVNAGKR